MLACVRMYIHVFTAAVYSACCVLSVYVYTYVLMYFIVCGRCDAFEDLCAQVERKYSYIVCNVYVTDL